jgi:hypothetical protein
MAICQLANQSCTQQRQRPLDHTRLTTYKKWPPVVPGVSLNGTSGLCRNPQVASVEQSRTGSAPVQLPPRMTARLPNNAHKWPFLGPTQTFMWLTLQCVWYTLQCLWQTPQAKHAYIHQCNWKRNFGIYNTLSRSHPIPPLKPSIRIK